MTDCAYCDRAGPVTKDHVWPECFLERTGRQAAHFSHQSKRAHGADYVVADVCDNCNNVLLSPLDGYFCRMYDEFFATTHDFHARIELRFDYHLLCRALLKIAFNSARSAGSDLSYLSPLRGYIRDGAPQPSQFAVFAELVSPTLVKDESAVGGVRAQHPTDFYRSVIAKLLTPLGDRLHARVIAVGSFYFHLLFPSEPMPDTEFLAAVEEIPAYVKGLVLLTPGEGVVTLQSSPQDAISSIVPHIQRNKGTYQEFYRRRKK